jgi:hypothetical protein
VSQIDTIVELGFFNHLLTKRLSSISSRMSLKSEFAKSEFARGWLRLERVVAFECSRECSPNESYIDEGFDKMLAEVRKMICCICQLDARLTLVAGLFCLVSGCTSISTTVPLQSGEGPRTMGEAWKWGGGFGYASTRDISFTEDASRRPVDLTKREIKQSGLATGYMNSGLGSHVDAFLKLSLTGTSMYGVRYQPIGSNRLQKSSLAEHSEQQLDQQAVARPRIQPEALLSFIFWGFQSSNSKSGEQNGTFGPGGFNWSATGRATGEALEILAGYQMNSDFMIFIGPTYLRYRASANVHNDISSDLTSPASDSRSDGAGTVSGGKFGIEFRINSGRTAFHVDGFFSQITFESLPAQSVLGFNLAFDI